MPESSTVPATVRTRESLTGLIKGRPSSADDRAGLVKQATRRIVEEALEAENRDVPGSEYYPHGASPGQRRVPGLATWGMAVRRWMDRMRRTRPRGH